MQNSECKIKNGGVRPYYQHMAQVSESLSTHPLGRHAWNGKLLHFALFLIVEPARAYCRWLKCCKFLTPSGVAVLSFAMVFLGIARPCEAQSVLSKETLPLGVVEQRPATGRCVAIENGYLVPYTARIPGTEVTFDMVPIPGGTFLLGSSDSEESRSDDEGPQVKITLPPFWIGKHEITWSEYKQFMRLTGVFEKFDDLGIRQITADNLCDAITSPSKLYDSTFTFQSGEDPELPAITMSQFAAKQYTKWLSLLSERFYRLPTEVEWEYACRAGTTTAYSFGDGPEQLDDYAWHYENSDDETHHVGQKRPNPWGLYDMHGNVEEWVLDGYLESGYAELAKTSQGNGLILAQPTKLFPRVLRGGSWDDEPDRLRSAARGQSNDDEWRSYDPNAPKSPWWFASDASQDVGFRILRPYKAPLPADRGTYWDADLPRIQKVADARIDKEGRGERGLVDPDLPAAIEQLRKSN